MDIEIEDLEALKKACTDLGLEFREGQRKWRWFGSWVDDYHAKDAAYHHGIKPEDYGKSDHAIGLPNNNEAYEIGVVKQGEKFALVYDFYGQSGSGIAAAVGGKECHKLLQAYSTHSVLKQLGKLAVKGFNLVANKLTSQGQVQLTYRKN